ncbi:MAG TPA: hypothetical protein VF299_10255 [Mycobacterium sp.]
MNNNTTTNSAAVDQAVRALIHALASAIAADTDGALHHGYGDLLLAVMHLAARPGLCSWGTAHAGFRDPSCESEVPKHP